MKHTDDAVILIEPIRDKIAYISIHSAKFEVGLVIFPLEASRLFDLEAELFALPAVPTRRNSLLGRGAPPP